MIKLTSYVTFIESKKGAENICKESLSVKKKVVVFRDPFDKAALIITDDV